MQITREFDEPYTERTAALPSSFSPSVIGLAGYPYLLDTESGQYQRQAVDVVQQRNTSDNRDLLLLPQDIWRQMQQSWHMGAGQSNVDRDTALPYRYADSFGINPWTSWKISLLNKTNRLLEVTNSNKCFLNNSGDNLAVTNSTSDTNTTIKWYTSLTATPYTQTGYGKLCINTTSDGSTVWTLHNDGKVYYQTFTAPSTAVSTAGSTLTANATSIGWVKDYLIAGDGNQLHNITGNVNPSTSTRIGTAHPNSAFRWIDFCEGSQFIYALGGVGDKWVIHKIGINPNTSALLPYITAATLPDGEIGYSIGSYLGYIFIGTSKGVRMAQADANGDLTLGSIIPTNGPVYCFEGQDRFVWYGNQSINGKYTNKTNTDAGLFPSNTATPGLGRMDLSVFTTNALTPAYANDLIAMNAGEFYSSTFAVQSLVTFAGQKVFTVNGLGVFYETSELMEAGWLTQGTVSFSVEDNKTALYAQAKWLPLSGAVGLDFSFESGDYARLATISTVGSIKSDNVYLNGQQFSRVDPRYVLKRGTTTTGPVFTRWEIRTFPVRGRASRWTLPIMNYEQLEIDGVIYNRDVLQELDYLIGFVQSGSIFTLQESGRTYTVYGKDFLWRPEKLSTNGAAWQGTFILVVEEIQ